jgi:hypothetical protein
LNYDTRQPIDGRKAQREVFAPTFTHGVNQEPRRAIGNAAAFLASDPCRTDPNNP